MNYRNNYRKRNNNGCYHRCNLVEGFLELKRNGHDFFKQLSPDEEKENKLIRKFLEANRKGLI